MERNHPAIDLVAHDSIGSIAIEHTLIEPFPREIELAKRLATLFPESFIDLPSFASDKIYTLLMSGDAIGTNKRDIAKFRFELLSWIDQVAQLPHEGLFQNLSIRISPPEGQFPPDIFLEVRNSVDGARQNGRLCVYRVAPREVESQRTERLLTALNEKIPKLCSLEYCNSTTMLVLENRDIFLTNQWLVIEALKQATTMIEMPLPDYVVLATTFESTHFSFIYERGIWVYGDEIEVPT